MRYSLADDSNLLFRAAQGPVALWSSRSLPPPISGRGESGLNNRIGARRLYALQGFGAAVVPVGQGAGAGAAIGASEGASIGSAIPVIGTAVGAIVGAAIGAIAGSINKMDPEQRNFDQAIALWQQNPAAVFNILNKYLALAGFFDLTQSQAGKIRIYRKYGRMGEQAFTNDMTAQIRNAVANGTIGPADTAFTIYSKVILPWEDEWQYGPEPPNPHSGFMDNLLTGMIWDYTLGNQKNWTARSGDYPFASLPPFTLPVAAPASVASAPATTSATNTATVSNSIASTVSTTPPAIGSAITYALDAATGKMVGIPAGGVYEGLTPTGAWLITYTGANAGTYSVQNGVMVPFATVSTTPISATPPAGYTLTNQSASINGIVYPLYSDTAGNLYVWVGGQMVPYSQAAAVTSTGVVSTSSGGGGGGGYYTPTPTTTVSTQPVTTTPVTGGLDGNTLLLIAGIAGAFLLLGHKS
jgi:hypothetical protein